MKKTFIVSGFVLLVTLGSWLVVGCNRPAEPAKPAIAPVEKSSFNEVTSRLDPGGELFVYLGTEQILAGISDKIAAWKQAAGSIPDLRPRQREDLAKGIDLAASLVRHSGLEEISGFGMSAIAVDTNLYRVRSFVHHYPNRNTGLLWQAFGRQPHPLAGLDLLPANTAFAMFSDLDVPLIWTEIKTRVAEQGLPRVEQFLDRAPEQFETATGMKWDTLMASLGGEFGIALTLNPDHMLPVPLPTDKPLEVPEPGLMILVRVKDDAIFNRVEEALKTTRQEVVKVDKPDVRMRTMPVPLPLPILLRPTLAASGGYLILASSDALVNEALAVRSGSKPGLKSTDEFKRLAAGIGTEANQFSFVSRQFTETALQIQHQVFAMNRSMDPTVQKWMEKLQGTNIAHSYCISANTAEGWLTTGNGTQQPVRTLLTAAVALPVGMIAAIAAPNFVKARQVSQKNACINNLRMIDAAKQQWALEKGLPSTAMPSKQDLLPYLVKGVFPTCPAGGTYTLDAVGEAPRCSIPGHSLSN
ncbi:MAG: DUF3352 domain-containing protein [Verrucomicrobiota bacterium]